MDTRLLRPWDFLGKSTGVGCHFLLQGTSRPRERTQVSHIVDRCFPSEPPGKPLVGKYIMWNARLDEAQAGVKIAGRNSNNLRYADDTTLMAESEELKSLLMNVKEESEKDGLKLNIQKTKIMTSGPIIHSKQMGKQWKQWQTLFFQAPKSMQMVIAAMKLKDTCSLQEKLWPT